MLSKSAAFFCLLVLVSSAFGENYENDGEVMRAPFQALKRGSLSNMMRIGKRQLARPQEYVDFPNEGQIPCEGCNLGTLMRIGRR